MFALCKPSNPAPRRRGLKSIDLPQETHAEAQREAARRKLTLMEFVRLAIEKAMKRT